MAHKRCSTCAKLVRAEAEARKAWYAYFNGGAPRKPWPKGASAKLTALEASKRALVNHTGAANFREAAAIAAYAPVYAARLSPAKEKVKATRGKARAQRKPARAREKAQAVAASVEASTPEPEPVS